MKRHLLTIVFLFICIMVIYADNATICIKDGYTNLANISSADYNTVKSRFRTLRLDLSSSYNKNTNGSFVSVILHNLSTGAIDWRSNRIQTLAKMVGQQIRDNSYTDRDITQVGHLVAGSDNLYEYTFSSDMEIYKIDNYVDKSMVWLKISTSHVSDQSSGNKSKVQNQPQRRTEHFSFMGIPINGTITQFQPQLLKKGFRLNAQKNKKSSLGTRIFSGKYLGEDCDLSVFYREKDKVVYAVKIVIKLPGLVTAKKMFEEFKHEARNNNPALYDLDSMVGYGAYSYPAWTLFISNSDSTRAIGKIYTYIYNFDYEYYYYNLHICYIDKKNAPEDEW